MGNRKNEDMLYYKHYTEFRNKSTVGWNISTESDETQTWQYQNIQTALGEQGTGETSEKTTRRPRPELVNRWANFGWEMMINIKNVAVILINAMMGSGKI
jgi:hypothetical protein